MRKILNAFVKKRYIVLAVMLVLTVISAFFIQKVEINSDMTEYLPDSSPMKEGLAVMESEFPSSGMTQNIRVMFTRLSEEEKHTIYTQLSNIQYVDSVDYDIDSDEYNKDDKTLYVLNMQYDYYSDEEEAIESVLASDFSEYDMVYKNDSSATNKLPLSLILIIAALVAVILIIMCKSYFEPLLFAAAIGAAIVLNLGTNVIMGSISITTFSLSSILQLVLSMDYAVILMNRYRQEKANCADKEDAMRSAVNGAFPAVTSSAFTTIVGLLALVFMSFKIGADLGIVLAKGVFLSMICTFTVLPALVMLCDKAIEKTTKKTFNIRSGALSTYASRAGKYVAAAFAVLLVGSYVLQLSTDVAYTLDSDDTIKNTFTSQSTLVVLYKNEDEDAVSDLAKLLSEKDGVKSAVWYSGTIGAPLSADEMAQVLSENNDTGSLDASLIKTVYYMSEGGEGTSVTLHEFFAFLNDDVSQNELFSGLFTNETVSYVSFAASLTDPDVFAATLSAENMAALFGMDAQQAEQIYQMYAYANPDSYDKTLSPVQFVGFILGSEQLSGALDETTLSQLTAAAALMELGAQNIRYTPQQIGAMLETLGTGVKSEETELMCVYYASQSADVTTMTMDSFVTYLADALSEDSALSSLLDDETKSLVTQAQQTLSDAKSELCGGNYSRLVLTLTLADESEQTAKFMEYITAQCSENLSGSYLIGTSEMVYELQQDFGDQLTLITLLSAAAIFIVVAVTFRNLLIPLLLVLLVQCGVFITVCVIGLQGYSMYYLAFLMVQCILMGATIDYAILFTNYYCSARETLDKKQSLAAAYDGSMHTVLTSGMIMIVATGVIGFFFSDPAIAQICRTISIGALSVVLLVLFVLPCMLGLFDRFIKKKKPL